MRFKLVAVALLVGFISVGTQAGVTVTINESAMNVGYMEVFDLPADGGAFQFGQSWAVPDLSATFDPSGFVATMVPNSIGDTSEFYYIGGGAPGNPGNKIMVAAMFAEETGTLQGQLVTFEGVVSSNTLTSAHTAVAFIRDFDPGYFTFNESVVALNSTGAFSVNLSTLNDVPGRHVQYGIRMSGVNVWVTDLAPFGSIVVTTPPDSTPPDPDPMTFAVDPYAISDHAISMTASNATDPSGVEYLFTNTVNNTSSGWQSSLTWIDAGPAGGVVTAELAIVNADFAAGGAGWDFDSNTGWGDPSGATTTNDGGNIVGLAYVNGSEDNGNGGYAVIVQEISLAGTDFSAGNTVTLSADIKALAGLNGGGAILKMESWAGGANLGADLEVPIAGTTESWDNYSMDYTIAVGADAVKVVLGTSTGWGGQNPIDSYYLFDDVVVSREVTLSTGLTPDTPYTYQVKARDTSVLQNETAWSTTASATTNVEDVEAPLPNPMTFASSDVSPITVKLTATTVTDASAVEYYFDCTAGGGNDSGWRSDPVYYDTGLVPGSNYSYTVIARDLSLASNSNTVSAAVNLTTLDAVSYEFNNALTGFSGNTDDPAKLFELEKAGLTTGSTNPDSTIDLDATGATFGDGLGTTGRNLLKTIASGYAGVSFEAYATLTFSGAADLSGFIGIGQGLQTGVPDNYGVPELNLSDVNGVVAQFKDTSAGSGVYSNSLIKIISGNPAENGGQELFSAPVSNTETIRAKLTYDAVAETVNVAFDKNYTGAAFVADQDMGTVSTSLTDTNAVAYSMWDGAPVRVYVGGGEGTIVKDFEIVVTGVPLTTFDLQVVDVVAGGGMIFSWEGALGQTYEVQYTTSLVAPVWNTDTTVGGDIVDLGGPMSATSTVGVAEAFYRLILK